MSEFTEKLQSVNLEAFEELKSEQKERNSDRSHSRVLNTVAKAAGLDRAWFKQPWSSEEEALTNALNVTCVGLHNYEIDLTKTITHGWGSPLAKAFLRKWDEVPDDQLPACMLFKVKGVKPLFVITDAEIRFGLAVPALQLLPGILPDRECAEKYKPVVPADRPLYATTLEMFLKAWTGSMQEKTELLA